MVVSRKEIIEITICSKWNILINYLYKTHTIQYTYIKIMIDNYVDTRRFRSLIVMLCVQVVNVSFWLCVK